MDNIMVLLKMLDVKTIEFLKLDFVDNHGNLKRITIDYPPERLSKDKEE